MSQVNAPIGRREMVVGGALALSSLGGVVLSHATDAAPRRISPLDQIIPARMGEWSEAPFVDLYLPRGEPAEEGIYDQVLTRYYSRTAVPPIMLLIAYGGSQSADTGIHRPEICYPAAGFTLDSSSQVTIPVMRGAPIAARLITARAPGRTEQILYWSRIGSEFPTSNFEQQLLLLRHAFSGSAVDGALVRVSTINPDPRSALMVLSAFTQALLRISDPRARALLLGRA
jgi:EpsI family protein